MNFVNKVHTNVQEASVIVGKDTLVKKMSNLYDTMIQTSVCERGIFNKLDKTKDFSINIVIQYDEGMQKRIKYSSSATCNLTIHSLLHSLFCIFLRRSLI